MSIINNNKFNFIAITFLLFLDQYSKYIIEMNNDKLSNKDFIFLTIEYLRNDGAAFNIFSGNRIFLSTISIISSIVLYYLIIHKGTNVINRYGLSFILAGSIGNGIDRIINGSVIDFINIKYFNFPIFNFADLYINIGVFILIIGYLKYKK